MIQKFKKGEHCWGLPESINNPIESYSIGESAEFLY
jgi:hypothetical protein